MVRSYEVERGFGCVRHTKRTANPVVASDCRVLPEQLLSSNPVMISLALSLALAPSGICNPLQKRNLELEARVGIGRIPPSTSHSKSTVYIITDALKIKAFLRYVKHNFSRLFLTPFYSQPMKFAGISAGTFCCRFTQPVTDWSRLATISCLLL
ncbi:MAG: hypothetical protein ACREDS_05375 [Limisphaerales bacterium]